MGRELKRKEAKRRGKNIKEINAKNNKKEVNQVKKLLTLLGIILLIIGCLYLFIGIVITKEIKWFSDDTEEITRVSNSILAKNTLKQVEEEYYVYFYDFDNENTSIETGFVSKLPNAKIYRVDTADGFNANFITEEETNVLVSNIDDLKVKAPTLVKVVSEEIVEYYEEDDVLSYLNS